MSRSVLVAIVVGLTSPQPLLAQRDQQPPEKSDSAFRALQQRGVVKAFNQTDAENMADPIYGGERTVMFYVGDDPAAKAIVRDLITAVGFEAVDAGALRLAWHRAAG